MLVLILPEYKTVELVPVLPRHALQQKLVEDLGAAAHVVVRDGRDGGGHAEQLSYRKQCLILRSPGTVDDPAPGGPVQHPLPDVAGQQGVGHTSAVLNIISRSVQYSPHLISIMSRMMAGGRLRKAPTSVIPAKWTRSETSLARICCATPATRERGLGVSPSPALQSSQRCLLR